MFYVRVKSGFRITLVLKYFCSSRALSYWVDFGSISEFPLVGLIIQNCTFKDVRIIGAQSFSSYVV